MSNTMVDIPEKTLSELLSATPINSKEAVYIAKIAEDLSNLFFNPNPNPNQLELPLTLNKETSK